jgi:hypothetical protein
MIPAFLVADLTDRPSLLVEHDRRPMFPALGAIKIAAKINTSHSKELSTEQNRFLVRRAACRVSTLPLIHPTPLRIPPFRAIKGGS